MCDGHSVKSPPFAILLNATRKEPEESPALRSFLSRALKSISEPGTSVPSFPKTENSTSSVLWVVPKTFGSFGVVPSSTCCSPISSNELLLSIPLFPNTRSPASIRL